MYAALKTVGTQPVESERLNSSVKKGARIYALADIVCLALFVHFCTIFNNKEYIYIYIYIYIYKYNFIIE